MLLKPLPWREPDRLVGVFVARPRWRGNPVMAGNSESAPHTFAAVALVLTATAVLAMLLPALRAARIDPVVVLRGE